MIPLNIISGVRFFKPRSEFPFTWDWYTVPASNICVTAYSSTTFPIFSMICYMRLVALSFDCLVFFLEEAVSSTIEVPSAIDLLFMKEISVASRSGRSVSSGSARVRFLALFPVVSCSSSPSSNSSSSSSSLSSFLSSSCYIYNCIEFITMGIVREFLLSKPIPTSMKKANARLMMTKIWPSR
jgi:hypothetical protein